MKKPSPARFGKPKRAGPHLDAEPVTVTIEAMGRQGHGMAQLDGIRLHIPFVLPGESVRIERHVSMPNAAGVENPSPGRIQPICIHFGVCGGCTLQHWREERYEAWKAGLVSEALARAGIDVPSPPEMRTYPVPSRRRATFTARNTGTRIELGYLAERSHALTDLAECPILLPAIARALPPLKQAIAAALPARNQAKLYVCTAANGLDCAVDGPPLAAAARTRLAGALGASGFIRFHWNQEFVFQTSNPFVYFGGVEVMLPPSAFLQAVEACEQDMADFVSAALRDAKTRAGPICDLFAGLGAFSFPAARFGAVTAYEVGPAAVAALADAAKQAKRLKPVSAIRRDLFRNPLGPLELNKFASAILDPPREGAEAQCKALAASKTPLAIMLSCNPGSFARDAAILIAGGYRLTRLTAFDQFRFSAHVEIAALFERPGRKSNTARGSQPAR